MRDFQPEELQIMELLLRIFRARMPSLPRTAVIFAETLQKTLTTMVSKPPQVPPTSSIMQELIACFCTTVQVLTHDFNILIRTLEACACKWSTARLELLEKPLTVLLYTSPNDQSCLKGDCGCFLSAGQSGGSRHLDDHSSLRARRL